LAAAFWANILAVNHKFKAIYITINKINVSNKTGLKFSMISQIFYSCFSYTSGFPNKKNLRE